MIHKQTADMQDVFSPSAHISMARRCLGGMCMIVEPVKCSPVSGVPVSIVRSRLFDALPPVYAVISADFVNADDDEPRLGLAAWYPTLERAQEHVSRILEGL